MVKTPAESVSRNIDECDRTMAKLHKATTDAQRVALLTELCESLLCAVDALREQVGVNR